MDRGARGPVDLGFAPTGAERRIRLPFVGEVDTRQIGRLSGDMARGSPKGMSKSGGLDVEAEERYAEVQKGRASVADWTLKRS